MGKFLLAALLAVVLVPATASAAYPYTGAQIVYVGLEEKIVPEEGFTGYEPVGLRGIRLGEPKKNARVLTNERSSAHPAVSADGRWIAFSHDGAITLMRPDGSGLRRLTNGGGGGSNDIEPNFAPSGKRILFIRLGDETVRGTNQGDVYSIGIDGSGLRQITAGRSADRAPVLSPNGRQIVFAREPVRSGPGGRAEWGLRHIFSIRADGSHMCDLTPRIPARSRRGELGFQVDDPAFSPNGRVIAFTVSNNGGGENIYTMRPNGRRIRSLTGVGKHPLSTRFQLSEPAFSPSGRFLLVTGRDGGHTELAVIDLAERSELLAAGGVEGEAAVWTPSHGD